MPNLSTKFAPIVSLIQSSRYAALKAVNKELIELYWKIGQYISLRVASEEWGKGVVTELARYIAKTEPSTKGFSDKNLWRMKQFYETYKDFPKLSTLLREISWSHNLAIMSHCQTMEEKEFYLQMSVREKYSFRELERQISASLFERAIMNNTKRSLPVIGIKGTLPAGFKDSYVFEFLDLPDPHTEKDLQKAILQNMKKFLLEFSRDFAFIGEEFTVQVGNKDFALDLLFFNRALNCLVAIELKVVDFIPEHLGKLNFYLEALDRDVKKPHENPSISILLCKAKDDEVVEYTMSRQLSPAMVAKYQLQLPDKKLLQTKLLEFFELNSM